MADHLNLPDRGIRDGRCSLLVDARPHDATTPLTSPRWREQLCAQVRQHLAIFTSAHCAEQLQQAHVDIATDVLRTFTEGGKFVRSTFLYLGWSCGEAAPEHSTPVLRAAASLELLHAFALIQDDVMDSAQLRRGRPAAHIAFGRWHRERALGGDPDRFGESAATLLGDLCLVWAEQMLRNSELDETALSRVWPRYDLMRTELAIGQFSDLVNDVQALPSLDDVLDVLRRKSGNYSVRRPLEMGAVIAGCEPGVVDALGRYGGAIGEAFQLRDDVLGVVGDVTETGKPAHTDLADHKATSVVIAAHQLAGPVLRRELTRLMTSPRLQPADIERWRELIESSGALTWIEDLIAERRAQALGWLDRPDIPDDARFALTEMAMFCTKRTT